MKVIDYKETMKCLDEVEDCEDKTYAKSLLEWAINKRTLEAVPMSAIEKITQTMEVEYETADELADRLSGEDEIKASFRRGQASGIKWVKSIIDKTVKEIKHESTRSEN